MEPPKGLSPNYYASMRRSCHVVSRIPYFVSHIPFNILVKLQSVRTAQHAQWNYKQYVQYVQWNYKQYVQHVQWNYKQYVQYVQYWRSASFHKRNYFLHVLLQLNTTIAALNLPIATTGTSEDIWGQWNSLWSLCDIKTSSTVIKTK